MGTLRIRRSPAQPHLRFSLLLSDRVSQQAALENRLHRWPQIVLAAKRGLISVPQIHQNKVCTGTLSCKMYAYL